MKAHQELPKGYYVDDAGGWGRLTGFSAIPPAEYVEKVRIWRPRVIRSNKYHDW